MDCTFRCGECGKKGHVNSRCTFFKEDGNLTKEAVQWKHTMSNRWKVELGKPRKDRIDPATNQPVDPAAYHQAHPPQAVKNAEVS